MKGKIKYCRHCGRKLRWGFDLWSNLRNFEVFYYGDTGLPYLGEFGRCPMTYIPFTSKAHDKIINFIGHPNQPKS